MVDIIEFVVNVVFGVIVGYFGAAIAISYEKERKQ